MCFHIGTTESKLNQWKNDFLGNPHELKLSLSLMLKCISVRNVVNFALN